MTNYFYFFLLLSLLSLVYSVNLRSGNLLKKAYELAKSSHDEIDLKLVAETDRDFAIRVTDIEDKLESDEEFKENSISDLEDSSHTSLDVSIESIANKNFPNIPYSEWSALRDFYNSTNGINWAWKGTGSHWNFSSYKLNNPCTDKWAGVLCTCNHYERPHYYYVYYYTYSPSVVNKTCNVDKLVLNNYNLVGTIPRSIGNLTQLTILFLHKNNLYGSLPYEINLLTKLTKIGFGTNFFSGQIPPLSNLPDLVNLYLFNNLFSGSIPSSFGNLTGLINLYVSNNKLTKSIPSTLGLLSNLETFDCDTNMLTGMIPSSFGNIPGLRYLYFYNNQLIGPLPTSFGGLINLRTLACKNNKINGPIPSSFGNMISLRILDISYNKLTGSLDSSLGKLTKILRFYVNNNKLIGSLPTSIGGLISVQDLDFSFNQLNNNIPSSLGSLISLQYLYLNNNFFNGTIPSFFSLLNKLQQLFLQQNNLQGSIPSNIGNSKVIKYIFLGNSLLNTTSNTYTTGYDNNLFGPIPEVYCQFTNLLAFTVPVSNLTCYPIDFYSKLNQNYLESGNHCPGYVDIALCDLTKTTNIGNIVQSTKIQTSQIIASPHPLPIIFKTSTSIYVPGALFYTVSINGYCQLPPGDVINICFDSSSNCLTPLTCTSKPVIITNPSFEIIFDRLFLLGNGLYGYELLIVTTTGYNGWQCSTAPSLYLNQLSSTSVYANNFCQWVGIRCVQGTVNQLILSGLGLVGTISPTISLLKSMQVLNLRYNSIGGVIPSSICNLTNIVALDFSSNKMSGFIPNNLYKLNRVVTVNFGSNQLIGQIPESIQYLNTSLQSFIVSDNRLTGQIPYGLCVLAINVSLQVSGNAGIGCYQSCGSTANSLQSQLSPCSPTSSPVNSPVTTFDPTPIIIVVCVVGGCLVILLFLYYLLLRRRFNQETIDKENGRYESLKLLPIHSFILSNNNMNPDRFLEEFLNLLDKYPETISQSDYLGKYVIDLVLEFHSTKLTNYNAVVSAVLRKCLPVKLASNGNIESVSPDIHCYAWTKVISSNLQLTYVVETILSENPLLCYQLSQTVDETGRTALSISVPECRSVILLKLYFFKRFEILTLNKAHYQSQTCIIHFAIDHQGETKKQVALKFMKNKESFINEVSIRSEAKFDSQYVIDIICNFDSDSDEEFRKCIIERGFSAYSYLIVMNVCDRNLNEIVNNGELIDQSDMLYVRNIIIQIVKALYHLHNRGFIHADVKPKNIMRSGGSFLLIDLDCSASIGKGFSGKKISSSYAPPELVYKKQDKDEYSLKISNASSPKPLDYEVVPANPSHDSWSLGMTIYYLMTKSTFFLCDSEGENICKAKDLKSLYIFSDTFKQDLLKDINNVQARNLLSMLLSKDPTKRPSMSQVLNHPFLTGKVPARMTGVKSEFEFFLSYRSFCDSHHAKIFYDKLVAKGFKVWLDSECLDVGKSMEQGFINGLCKSRVFLPILSRETFVNQNQNIMTMTKESPSDPLLLEYRLAAELQMRGMVELVCPILIGDFDPSNKTYSNYFNGCQPDTKRVGNIVIDSIEKKVIDVLDEQSLGLPLIELVSIKDVIDSITKNQGFLLEGNEVVAIDEVINKLTNSLKCMNDADESEIDGTEYYF